MDEKLFNALLPHKDAWREEEVSAPARFVSQALYEKAFEELFICKRLSVDSSVEGASPSRPFTRFRSVRECAIVEIVQVPMRLGARELSEWLTDTLSRSKWLHLHGSALDCDVKALLQKLKEVSRAEELDNV